MESKLTKYTKELKVQKWTELVMNCNSSGMSKAEWCRENNINLKSLYYWQHKLRMNVIQTQDNKSVGEIVQINLQEETTKDTDMITTDKIIIRKCGIEIELPMNDSSVCAIIKGLVSC